MDSYRSISLRPGEEFNVEVVALGQTGFPVPTIIFNKNEYDTDQYSLPLPSSQPITCAYCNQSFQLDYGNTTYGSVKLYPLNPCQSIIDGLTLRINIEPCPLGFELTKNQQCSCDKRLIKFTQECSIDKSSATVQREKNNFWISQIDLDILLIHEFRCPLDYCKDISECINISESDPSVQCDFNRTGIVCGQCRENFSLALGSLHCIPCNNKFTALVLFFMIAGLALIAITFLF